MRAGVSAGEDRQKTGLGAGKGDKGHDWRGGTHQILEPKFCPEFGWVGLRAS